MDDTKHKTHRSTDQTNPMQQPIPPENLALDKAKTLAKLLHHKNSTVGLWATDRPELIPADIKDNFSEITYG